MNSSNFLNILSSASNSDRDIKEESYKQEDVEAVKEIDLHVEANVNVAEGDERIGVLGQDIHNKPVVNPSVHNEWKGEANALIEVNQVLLVVLLFLLVYRLLMFFTIFIFT